jgi:hypothetical protein
MMTPVLFMYIIMTSTSKIIFFLYLQGGGLIVIGVTIEKSPRQFLLQQKIVSVIFIKIIKK